MRSLRDHMRDPKLLDRRKSSEISLKRPIKEVSLIVIMSGLPRGSCSVQHFNLSREINAYLIVIIYFSG